MIDSNNNEKYFYEINKDQYNLFYFNLKDKNGNIYLKGGSYTLKTNCKHGIRSIIRNSKNEFRFEIVQPLYKKWVVQVKAGNGRVLAISDCFDKEEEAENLIEDLKYLSLETALIDNTK